MSNEPTYDQECAKCDHSDHICPGCGEPLRHDGKQFDGTAHRACT